LNRIIFREKNATFEREKLLAHIKTDPPTTKSLSTKNETKEIILEHF